MRIALTCSLFACIFGAGAAHALPTVTNSVVVQDEVTFAYLGWVAPGAAAPLTIELVFADENNVPLWTYFHIPVHVVGGMLFYAAPADKPKSYVMDAIQAADHVTAFANGALLGVTSVERVVDNITRYATVYDYGGCSNCVQTYLCFCNIPAINSCPASPPSGLVCHAPPTWPTGN